MKTPEIIVARYESDPWRGQPAAPPTHSMGPSYHRSGGRYAECRWCGRRRYPDDPPIEDACSGIAKYRRLAAARRIARRITS